MSGMEPWLPVRAGQLHTCAARVCAPVLSKYSPPRPAYPLPLPSHTCSDYIITGNEGALKKAAPGEAKEACEPGSGDPKADSKPDGAAAGSGSQ